MTTPNDRFKAAAQNGACNFMRDAGSALTQFGVFSLVTGTGAGPLAAGLAAQMVTSYACDWDPEGPAPPNTPPTWEGCKRVEGGVLKAECFAGNGEWDQKISGIIEVYEFYLLPVVEPGIGIIRYSGELVALGEVLGEFSLGVSGPTEGGGVCRAIIDEDRSGPDARCVEPPPEGPPIIPPTVYEDPESGCTLNVEFKGIAAGAGGTASPVFKITEGAQLRNDGGRVGGCNFEPTIYMLPPGGGGEPPLIGPWNPLWDDDPDNPFAWGDFLRELATGVASEIIADQLKKLFESPYSGAQYVLNPSCEGEDPPEEPVVIDIPALNADAAILSRLDALTFLLQGQKDLKQPICRERPKLEGKWRTISFRSQETSPFGKSRLRKRFRYRSLSGFGLEQLVDYWASFSFEAGPVCVIHKGAFWGTPQVWAASADEGKRVIRHAAGEAGLNPDQTGEWIVSGSDSARVGVSGTMNIDTTGGFYWITDRDGSTGRPIVAKT